MVVEGSATVRERKGEHEQGGTGERNRGGVFPGRFWAAQQQLAGSCEAEVVIEGGAAATKKKREAEVCETERKQGNWWW